MKIFDMLGGRKAVGLIIILAIAVPVALALGDVPTNLMTILLGAFGTFSVANGAVHIARTGVEKLKEANKDVATAGRPRKVDLGPVLTETAAIKEALATIAAAPPEPANSATAEAVDALSKRQVIITQQITGINQNLQSLITVLTTPK